MDQVDSLSTRVVYGVDGTEGPAVVRGVNREGVIFPKYKYKGEVKDGCIPDGKGILYHENNEKFYEGDFKNGMAHGLGIRYNEDGSLDVEGKFENGEFKQAVSHRITQDSFVVGDNVFESDFVFCVCTEVCGVEYLYTGLISKDKKPDGFGILFKPHGSRTYEGKFKDGVPFGHGKQFNDDGSVQYEGQYLDGRITGKGKWYYPAGKVQFEGEFINAKPHKGTEYFPDGKIKSHGKFLDKKLVSGKKYATDGSCLEGDHSSEKGFRELTLYDSSGAVLKKGTFKDKVFIRGCQYLQDRSWVEADVSTYKEVIEYTNAKFYTKDGKLFFKGKMSSENGLMYFETGTLYYSDEKKVYKGGFFHDKEAENFGLYDGKGTLYEYDSEGKCTEFKVEHRKGDLIDKTEVKPVAKTIEIKNYEEAKNYLKKLMETSGLGSVQFTTRAGKSKNHSVVFSFSNIRRRDELFKFLKASIDRNKKNKVVELKQDGRNGDYKITISFVNDNNFVSLFDLSLIGEIDGLLRDSQQVNYAPKQPAKQKVSTTTSTQTTKKININKAQWKDSVEQHLSLGGEVSGVSEQNRMTINYSSLFIMGESGRREYSLKISKSSSRKDDFSNVSVSVDQLKNILTRFKTIPGIKIIENSDFISNLIFELEFTDENPNIEELKKLQDVIAEKLIGSPGEQKRDTQAVKRVDQPEIKAAFSSAAAAVSAEQVFQENPFDDLLNLLEELTGSSAFRGMLKVVKQSEEDKKRSLQRISCPLNGKEYVSVNGKLVSSESLLRYAASLINGYKTHFQNPILNIYDAGEDNLQVVLKTQDFDRAARTIRDNPDIKASLKTWVEEQVSFRDSESQCNLVPQAILRENVPYSAGNEVSIARQVRQGNALFNDMKRKIGDLKEYREEVDKFLREIPGDNSSCLSNQIQVIRFLNAFIKTCRFPEDIELHRQLSTLRTIFRHAFHVNEFNKDFIAIGKLFKKLLLVSGTVKIIQSDDSELFDLDRYLEKYRSDRENRGISSHTETDFLKFEELILNNSDCLVVLSAACNIWEIVKINRWFGKFGLTKDHIRLISEVSRKIGHDSIKNYEDWIQHKSTEIKSLFKLVSLNKGDATSTSIR